jgi:hypothetical protein
MVSVGKSEIIIYFLSYKQTVDPVGQIPSPHALAEKVFYRLFFVFGNFIILPRLFWQFYLAFGFDKFSYSFLDIR